MKLSSKIRKSIMSVFVKPPISNINRLEEKMLNNASVMFCDQSPVRFEITNEMLKLDSDKDKLPGFPKTIPIILGSILDSTKILSTLYKNEGKEKDMIDEKTLSDLEHYAKANGAASIGYTKVPRKFVFKNRAVTYENAIIITMEMDKDILENAPSKEAGVMVHQTYNKLGKVAIRIADFLRQNGFKAQAGHPLMGQALYPALGELSGIGFHGLHGLLITPEKGPRIRIATIYTNIKNLPLSPENNHEWIERFCLKCKLCVKYCPGKAIYEMPIKKESGLMECIDTKKCFRVFAEEHGCSVCLKVCPFNRIGYEKVYRAYMNNDNTRWSESKFSATGDGSLLSH